MEEVLVFEALDVLLAGEELVEEPPPKAALLCRNPLPLGGRLLQKKWKVTEIKCYFFKCKKNAAKHYYKRDVPQRQAGACLDVEVCPMQGFQL